MEDFDELPKMAEWHDTKTTVPIEQMILTNKLRFVERDSYSKNGEHFTHPHKVKILQQWWASTLKFGGGQWKDIPLEEENT
jgi:hypothetical protein